MKRTLVLGGVALLAIGGALGCLLCRILWASESARIPAHGNEPVTATRIAATEAAAFYFGGAGPFRIGISKLSENADCGREISIALMFIGSSDCTYVSSTVNEPYDCQAIEVHPDGTPLARINEFANPLMSESLRSIGFAAHTSYTKSILLNRLFDFSKPGDRYFRFQMVVHFNAGQTAVVISPVVRVTLKEGRRTELWHAIAIGNE